MNDTMTAPPLSSETWGAEESARIGGAGALFAAAEKPALTPLRAAIGALRQGLRPIPLHRAGTPRMQKVGGAWLPKLEADGTPALYKGKEPLGSADWGWQIYTEAQLQEIYRTTPGAGVGLLLGEAGGIIDLDIDDPVEGAETLRAIFPDGLPATRGWSGQRGDHLIFRWDERVLRYGKAILKHGGIEFRLGAERTAAKQLQSVIPPTPYLDGAPRVWNGHREILPIPDCLLAYLDQVVAAQAEQERRKREAARPTRGRNATPTAGRASDAERARAYVDRMPSAVSGQGGHNQTYAVACVLADGFALDWSEAWAILSDYNDRCDPPWSEAELQHKLEDAMAKPRTGHLLEADRPGWNRPTVPQAVTHQHGNGNDGGARLEADSQDDGDANRGGPVTGGGTPGGNGGDRPTIVVNDRSLGDVTGDALAAIAADNRPPHVFNRGGCLARIQVNEVTGVPQIAAMDGRAVRGYLGRIATWVENKPTRGGVVTTEVYPPMDVVHDLLALPAWDRDTLPPLEGLVICPLLDREGRLIDRPGYHPESRLVYQPPAGVDFGTIPRNPTPCEIGMARDLILEDLWGDMPFADDASRAHALAAMLEPFVRLMIDGPVPPHLIDAPKAGTGKGKLAKTITIPAAGDTIASSPEKTKEDEWRKAITSMLMKGAPFVLLDNLNHRLDCGALASAFTERVWEDRLLTTNQMACLPIRCSWLLTSNNLLMSDELRRRMVLTRIDASCQDPADRPASSYRHPNLVAWALEQRVPLLRACLTLCQAWIAAGKPLGTTTVGSYEAWAQIMGGILEVAHVEGFLANRDQLKKRDIDSIRWPALVGEWQRQHGTRPVASKDLLEIITHGGMDESFGPILGDGSERSQLTRLGDAMSRQVGKVWDVRGDQGQPVASYKIALAEIRTRGGSAMYTLVRL